MDIVMTSTALSAGRLQEVKIHICTQWKLYLYMYDNFTLMKCINISFKIIHFAYFIIYFLFIVHTLFHVLYCILYCSQSVIRRIQ